MPPAASGGALLAAGGTARLGCARATGSLSAPSCKSQVNPHLAGIAARMGARAADRFHAKTLREMLLKLVPLRGHHLGWIDEANRQQRTGTAGHGVAPLSGEIWETILRFLPADTTPDRGQPMPPAGEIG